MRGRWLVAALAIAGVGTTWFAVTRAGAAQGADSAPPARTIMSLQTRPPAGAVLLLSGKADDMQTNWYQRYSTNPSSWTVDADGVATPQKGDVTSKQEFGDCQLHVEFRSMTDDTGKVKGHGNSGVGLQGRYEIQVLNSFGAKPESHGCGSIYSQIAPRVNACRPGGQWQTFDIVFRAPRADAAGQVTAKPRMTVYHNGILIQNNEEASGPTGIQYGELKGMPATGPVILQGDHDPVQYRNIWIVPL